MRALLIPVKLKTPILHGTASSSINVWGINSQGNFIGADTNFGRWYHIIWMEKFLGGHTENPPAVKSFGEVRSLIADKLGIW